jgi:hypothetical protein
MIPYLHNHPFLLGNGSTASRAVHLDQLAGILPNDGRQVL